MTKSIGVADAATLTRVAPSMPTLLSVLGWV